MRAPMARAVVGGLITSTLLTLFVVPVMYTLVDDATRLDQKPFRKEGIKIDEESKRSDRR